MRFSVASIRKRNTKWQVQIRRTGSTPISKSFHYKSDAQRWAKKTEAKLEAGEEAANTEKLDQLRFYQLIEQYRDTVAPHKKGNEVESWVLNAFLRQPFANLTLRQLTPDVFASYRDQRLKTAKPSTLVRQLGLLQHVIEIAIKEWNVPLTRNPIAQIRKPRIGEQRSRRLKEGELDLLLAASKGCRNVYVMPLVLLAIETGMRRSELLGVRKLHFDPVSMTLHLPETKNGSSRTIPLSPSARDILTKSTAKNEDRLFPISASALGQAWKRLTRRAGIADLRFHDLRHEAISRLFEKGLAMPEVALISGHRDYRMLQRYTHLKAEDVVEKLK